MSSSRNNLKCIAYNNVDLDNKWNAIFMSSIQAHKWFYCLVIVPLFFVMALFKFVNILFLCSILFSQDPYSLEDVNPNSITYGQNVGSSFFSGKVVLHYFGAFTWGTCTTRFGELNEINDDLKNSGYQVELIGVSKSSWQAGLVNWTNQGSAAICIDESPYLVWDDWEAIQRDLFITDLNGQVVYKQNITSGIPSNIVDIISGYLNVHQEILPDKFLLKQNYPNPFNPKTSIRIDLKKGGMVEILIYDLKGSLIQILNDQKLDAGEHTFNWDAGNYSNGVYLMKINTTKKTFVKKVILMK